MSSESRDTASSSNLAGSIRHGLLWSTLNSLALRLGSLLVGIVLARLLVPADFGVYAVALTIQSVLVTFADLGMSADLVRSEDPRRRAPTVATISFSMSILLAVGMSVSAGPVADLMGAPHATNTIMVLSWSIVISGAGVVPYALLQRNFQQRKLFVSSTADFAISTVVTIALVLLGLGPIALAIGRVVAQTVATTLQFVFARVRPRFGFDREIARSATHYGLPLAAANMLSWALLNVDNVVISRVAGATALGLYVLAFNVSSWPMSAIGQAVRSVSLAGFSHASRDDEKGDGGLFTGVALTWAAALPAGVLLAALSRPLIELLYGKRWSESAVVLAALGMFGALRVVLDLLATYLMARGASRPVLYVQIVWFVGLIPAVIVATRWKGIAGAGWSHLFVSAVLVLPAYAIALWRIGSSPRVLFSAMWVPTLAALPTWWAAHTVSDAIGEPVLALLAGGLAGTAVYLALCGHWLRPMLPPVRLRRRRPLVVEAEGAS